MGTCPVVGDIGIWRVCLLNHVAINGAGKSQKSHAVALERQMHQSTEGTTGVKGGETIGFR